ncbi:UDP-glucuronic acid decarboxylase family protein [Antarcticirhabdus aurantiaca]
MGRRMNLDKGRALVCGGAGFLGSHVCERLLLEGMDVVCFDNLQTGARANIAHLLRDEAFTFVEGCVCEDLPEGPFDEIWNLASPASPPRYQIDPVGTLMTNVVGTRNGLDLARRWNARFFQASTSEVYGDPEVHPQREDYRGAVNATGPRACYDEGKRAAETLCFDYRRMYEVDVRVARIFNTYGPRMDPEDGRVVSNFVVNALASRPLELYGGGEQTRSFCYRDDLVDGFLLMMRHPDPIEVPVNLGNPVEVTVRELGELVHEMIGTRPAYVSRPMPIDDPRQRRPDISRARELLGWEPRTPLRLGLEKTIAYFAKDAARRRQSEPALS